MERRNYRVDFILLRPNPKQNRNAFTFTIAGSAVEAQRKVQLGHPTEKLKITSVTLNQ